MVDSHSALRPGVARSPRGGGASSFGLGLAAALLRGRRCFLVALLGAPIGCGDDSGSSLTVTPTSDSARADDTGSTGEDATDSSEPDTATSPLDTGRDTGSPIVDTGRDTGTPPADTRPVETGPLCSGGKSDCHGSCIDLLGTDSRNCGRCGNVCGVIGTGGPDCKAGACYCASGLCEGSFTHCIPPEVDCLGGCHDYATDPLACGACGVVCAAGETCSAGKCCVGAVCSSCGDGKCRSPYEDKTSCPADCH